MINDLMVAILGEPTASTGWLYPVLGAALFIGFIFCFFKLLSVLFRL